MAIVVGTGVEEAGRTGLVGELGVGVDVEAGRAEGVL